MRVAVEAGDIHPELMLEAPASMRGLRHLLLALGLLGAALVMIFLVGSALEIRAIIPSAGA